MRLVSIGVIATIAASFLLNACGSKADTVMSSFDQANVAWSECRTKIAMAGIKTPLTAEELVDKAFAACAEVEARFYAAGVAEFGTEWRKSGGYEQSKIFRQAMLVRINEIRADKPATNPFIAWGNCTHRRSEIERNASDSINSSVERILFACKTFQDAVLSDATKRFGRAGGQEVIDTSLPKIRSHLANYLQILRSQPNLKARSESPAAQVPLAPTTSP